MLLSVVVLSTCGIIATAVHTHQRGIGYDVGLPESVALGTPGYSQSSLLGDVNGNGIVNILDLVLVASHLGASDVSDADINSDGIINVQDLVLVANMFGGVIDAQ